MLGRIRTRTGGISGWKMCMGLVAWFAFHDIAHSEELSRLNLARDSIKADDVRNHIYTLASDSFEGRQAGARGGRAASIYLAQQFQKFKLHGSVSDKTFFQEFGELRNILGVIPGSDPELKKEYLVIGAHFDHVGYGNRQNSNGPVGQIHNGADDNASGTSALLEIAEAWATHGVHPRRSLLFALWDGEEDGLLGSKHWVNSPTVPLAQVRCMINMDMVGRLRDNKVEVTGIRSLAGLRKIAAVSNATTKLELDFPWIVEDNSDHWPFYERRIPFFMPFTGFHDDYHRPSDDVDKLNYAGLEQVARWMFLVTHELAVADELPGFREAAFQESPALQKQIETVIPQTSRWGGFLAAVDGKPGRLIRAVSSGSPAALVGLRAGERITRVGEKAVAADCPLGCWLLQKKGAVRLQIQTPGAVEERTVTLMLDDSPIRVGVSWREDPAEPGVMIVTRIEPGSPADLAELKPLDRVLAVKEHAPKNGDDFRSLLLSSGAEFPLQVERKGQLRTVLLQLMEDESAVGGE